MLNLHILPSSVYFVACTGMIWMRLFSTSFEEISSHSHNPKWYASHPSGKTDSHIAGCRITLSQQDRNEQWQHTCGEFEALRQTSFFTFTFFTDWYMDLGFVLFFSNCTFRLWQPCCPNWTFYFWVRIWVYTAGQSVRCKKIRFNLIFKPNLDF